MARKLTVRREKFVQCIIKGMNQADAYRAVFECPTATNKTIKEEASKLAAHPDVRARIEELKERSATKAVMTRTEALERLSNFARTDLADLVEFNNLQIGEDEKGQPILSSTWNFKPSALEDPKKMAAIAELTTGRGGMRIKTHSPLAAIQQLAKMQGWEAAAKHELTGAGGGPIQSVQLDPTKLTDEAIEQILEAVTTSEVEDEVK